MPNAWNAGELIQRRAAVIITDDLDPVVVPRVGKLLV
jgi:hypothetical protein